MAQATNQFHQSPSSQTPQFQHYGPVSKQLLNDVKAELRSRGAVAYDMWLPETQFLPNLLHTDEHIMGSVYGRYDRGPTDKGRGVLVATDQRVLFLDKKPLFMHVDELTYMIIGGITFTRIGSFMGYVTLHSRLGDYMLRTFNIKNAANFVDYIETRCLQQEYQEQPKFDHVT